jgi:membrane protease YdiL (CAAX protease family)
MDGVIRSADETSWKLTIAFMGGLLYLWGWLLVNVPELQRIAVVYEFMTFLAVMIGGLAYVGARHFGVLGFPPLKEIPTTTAVGATVGLLWLIIGGQIARLAGMQVTFYQTLPPLIAYFFAFAIASTEETLLRGAVLPSITTMCGKLTAIILTSIMFSALHWLAFNAQLPFLLSAFLFSIIISALTLHYRTAWVAGAAHITYNLVTLYFLIGAP